MFFYSRGMKSETYLETESVPEWRKAYVDYKRLKKALDDLMKDLRLYDPIYQHENDSGSSLSSWDSPRQSVVEGEMRDCSRETKGIGNSAAFKEAEGGSDQRVLVGHVLHADEAYEPFFMSLTKSWSASHDFIRVLAQEILQIAYLRTLNVKTVSHLFTRARTSGHVKDIRVMGTD